MKLFQCWPEKKQQLHIHRVGQKSCPSWRPYLMTLFCFRGGGDLKLYFSLISRQYLSNKTKSVEKFQGEVFELRFRVGHHGAEAVNCTIARSHRLRGMRARSLRSKVLRFNSPFCAQEAQSNDSIGTCTILRLSLSLAHMLSLRT